MIQGRKSTRESQRPAAFLLPECVCASLRQASRAITLLYDEALRPVGLTAMQFQILSTIRALEEASIKELVTMMTIDQTTLTRSLALMMRQGWLSVEARADRRSKAFRLTAGGRKLVERAGPVWQAMQTKAKQRLDAADWQATRVVLESLIRLAGE